MRVLPSVRHAPITTTVGMFECPVDRLADWLADVLGEGWRTGAFTDCSWPWLADWLSPHVPLTRYVLVPLTPDWTAVLNNAPNGTDVGVLPMHVSRRLGAVSIRATSIPNTLSRFPGTILEVWVPPEEPGGPSVCRRSIAAANDGGRWVFEQTGEPYEFEDVSAYGQRRIASRFSPEMLDGYLGQLGVPDATPDGLQDVAVVERVASPS